MGNKVNQFSVILPVRNGGHYVKDCVNSILAQSYTYFNLIILDNNSTDGTREWLECLQNERIVIYKSHKDLSITESWARAVDVSKNEYMTLIGHDDILEPNFLDEINQLIINHPNASLYHTHFNFIDASSKVIKACKQMPNKITNGELLAKILKIEIDMMGTGYVFKSADYDKIGGIPLKYPNLLFADFELWLNLTDIKEMVISQKNCFSFRVHQSTTTNSSNQNYIEGFKNFINFLKLKYELLAYKNIIEQNILRYVSFHTKGMAHRLIKTSPQKRTNEETVQNLLLEVKCCVDTILPNNSFNAQQQFSVKLALWIDNSKILRCVFLWFKKVIKKPILG
jgi:glycosyltransferase involved in cell wall biosynthesis